MAGILFTGFEPFGEVRVNPAWEAVCALPDAIDGHPVHRALLPVVYGLAGDRLAEAAAACAPELIICVGAAASRRAITPELVALNWRMAEQPDNAGIRYTGERIDPNGPVARMTPLPVVEMVSALRAAGIPAQVSLSAGGYVCNDLYWHLLSMADMPGLFVHVPLPDAVDTPTAAHALVLCARAGVRGSAG